MPSRLTWIARRTLGTVGGRTLAVLLLLVVTYQAALSLTAGGKVAEGITATADARGRVAVDVVLGFPPERFHVLELQEYGRVRGTDGHVLHLRSVEPDDLRAIARRYWIRELRPGQD